MLRVVRGPTHLGQLLQHELEMVERERPPHDAWGGEQRGGHVDKGNATFEGTSHKTSEVKDDPSPYIDDQTISVGAIFQQHGP